MRMQKSSTASCVCACGIWESLSAWGEFRGTSGNSLELSGDFRCGTSQKFLGILGGVVASQGLEEHLGFG